MLKNRRRALSLLERGRGSLDWIVVLTTAALIVIGLIAIANATMDPYAVGEEEGLFGVISRLTSDSFYWQLLWVGIGLVAIVLILLTFLTFAASCPHCGALVVSGRLITGRRWKRPDRCPKYGAILTDNNLT